MTNSITSFLKFANLQMAAEALFTVDQGDPAGVAKGNESLSEAMLIAGNNRASKFTDVLAKQFMSDEWEVVQHKGNTETGFSGTLFKYNGSTNVERGLTNGELVLSFRSTEFADDAVRDSKATNELEIKEYGWAFGQIADMKNWVDSLYNDGKISPENALNVTGYSLGGHLATAFNLLYPGAVQGTYTFNGAGVGEVTIGSLAQVIAEFESNRNGAGLTFTNTAAANKYAELRERFNGTASAPAITSLDIETVEEDLSLGDDRFRIALALQRAKEVADEQARVANITNSGPGGDPKEIPLADIMAVRFDYQYATLLAGEKTSSYRSDVVLGGWAAVAGRTVAPSGPIPNFYDIYGANAPSAVANSQYHYGQETPIFIENQPLYRGEVLLRVIEEKLLDNEFSTNDFGDTHSLVLLIDSLSVQNLFAELDPNVLPEDLAKMFQAASNLRVEHDYGHEGKAEADVLENVLDGLRNVFMGGVQPKTVFDSKGGTWADLTTRNNFYSNLEALQKDLNFKTAKGRFQVVTDFPTSVVDSEDFSALLSLVYLTPFVLIPKDSDAVAVLKNAQPELAARWEADRALTEGEEYKENFTEKYLLDRMQMLHWMRQRNDGNFSDTELVLTNQINEKWAFKDITRDLVVNVAPPDAVISPIDGIFVPKNQVIFGRDNISGDNIIGGDGIDKIYGGTGNDTLVGGIGNDYIEGNSDVDLIEGGSGDDTLLGGDGDDTLDGGAGYDFYSVDEGDTIRDSDGAGEVWLNGKKLTFAIRKKGETTYRDKAGNTFVLNEDRLEVNDPLVVEGFDNGEFGIYLDEEEDPENPPEPPIYNPQNSTRIIDPLVLDLNGNGKIDTIGSAQSTAYFDFNRDGVAERSGWITSGDGLLAIDVNENSAIDDLSELFGTADLSGFADLKQRMDSNGDDVIDAADTDVDNLRIWQDRNGDGIAQSGELLTLDELGIQSINLNASTADIIDADNRISATGSFVRDGQTALIGDVEFAVNFAITDANPNRPLNQDLALDGDVFQLPWLRGYGQVAHLHQAYQDSPDLKRAAFDLINGGADAILANFDSFLRKWTGLEAAHQAAGVTRTNITIEDKVWMLETLTGQDVNKTAIVEAGFNSLFGQMGRRLGWNESYINSQYAEFSRREAIAFAMQATAKDWLKGAYYSLSLDRFVATDPLRLQASLRDGLLAIDSIDQAKFAALTVLRLKADGADIAPEILKQGLAPSPYTPIIIAALEFSGENIVFLDAAGWISATDDKGWIEIGSDESDTLQGRAGKDVLQGNGGDDWLVGGAGNDTYLFNLGDGQDAISEQDDTIGNVDTIRFGEGIAAEDIRIARSGNNLVLSVDGTSDSLEIQNWGSGDSFRIERVEFADGTTWDAAYLQEQVAVLPIVGTSGNNYLQGETANNILDGGVGNDTLRGEAGNDTYVFNLGGGADTIMEFDGTPGNVDTIRFGEGIAAEDIRFFRLVNSLVLSVDGTTDSLTIQNWGFGDSYRIEQVKFADGTTWDSAYLQAQAAALIVGTSGNDYLRGDTANNILDGGAGNDTLLGETGNDTYVFNPGGGADTISEQDDTIGNVDTIRFGAGIAAGDIRFAWSGTNLVLSVDDTSDSLTIQNWRSGDFSRIERVEFADGTIWDAAYLQAQVSALPIIGTNGNDNLQGDATNNILDGGAGNDTLRGGAGSDTYVFNLGGGQDAVFEYDFSAGNVDTIRFGEGIVAGDIRFSRSVDNLVLSVDGASDSLTIQNWGSGDFFRIEQVIFADGTTWDAAYLQEQAAAVPIVGTSGNDDLRGDAANNILDGGAGNDTLSGETGNDTYVFNLGGGKDTVTDLDGTTGNVDTVRFGEGIVAGDIRFSRSGNNLVLSVDDTSDSLTIQNWGSGDSSRIERVEFADGTTWDAAYLQEQAAAVPIVGTSGNDDLRGDAANNILDGGAGNDTLSGETGNDTYVFNLGGGKDTISEPVDTAGNVDTIRFGEGIAAEDIRFGRSDNNLDLVLSIDGTTDSLTIRSWGTGGSNLIERVKFFDGTTWDAAYLQEQVVALPIAGTYGNDILQGDAANNILDGGAGNDTLRGWAGNDTYVFSLGGGTDTIFEYDGTASNVDTIRFGGGIAAGDIRFAWSGTNLVLSIDGTSDSLTIENWTSGNIYRIERVEFADGTIWDAAYLQEQVMALPIAGTSGNDNLQGDATNNILDGGAGNDTLRGGAGSDTYVFNLGSGQDMLVEFDGTTGNMDTIRFGEGIAAEDIRFSRSGNNLVLSIKGASDQLTIENWGSGVAYRIERVEFANGTIWDEVYLQALVEAAPIIGTSNSDYLQGDTANNTFDGGAGNDKLQGGAGNDTYVFNLGSGQDTIVEFDGTTGNVDTIRFGEGIAAEDIRFSRSGNNLVLSIEGASDSLTIESWGSGEAYRIERVEFADGTTWDTVYLQAQVAALPIVGTSGDDDLQGDAANNTLDGDAGYDKLAGGSGNDTYLFSLGGGQDTISEYDETVGNVDTIRFGAGIAAEDIRFSRSGNNLVLGIDGTSDSLTIQNWGSGDAYRIERVEFADGTAWDKTYLQTQVAATSVIGADDADDHLVAWAGENANLQGLAGADILSGNDGDDVMDGGHGNDTYVFNLGGGHDTIHENDDTADNFDTIRFGTGIDASDIRFTQDESNLVLSIDGTSDQLTIANWGNGSAYRIEQVEFTDGTTWDATYLQAQFAHQLPLVAGTDNGDDSLYALQDEATILRGLGGNDLLYGKAGNDVLDGGAGDDYLVGGQGNDTYLFNPGDGQDGISDYDETTGNVDTIRFGEGLAASDIRFARDEADLLLSIDGTSDQLILGDWGDDEASRIERIVFADGTEWDKAYLQMQAAATQPVGTDDDDYLQAWDAEDAYLQGMEGSDEIVGANGNDTLIGGAGDDYLYGENGNDMLAGDTGDDYLSGDKGNDTYLFNPGDGQDTISEYGGTSGNVDTIRFGEGIAAGDIRFARNGEDLVLSIDGTSDSLTIRRWGNGDAYRIERVEFADGTTWDAAYLQEQAALPIIGTSVDDSLYALKDEVTVLRGLGGNDYLYGKAGNDVLDGGTGADYLMGSQGNDTYLFNPGDGQDTISEYDATSGNMDTIRFGEGIAAEDVRIARSVNNLVLSIGGTSDQITIQNWGYGDANRIERVEFADGTTWDAAYLRGQVAALPIVGTSGNDSLQGDAANNTFDGDAGNDQLAGGNGNDAYLFNLGGGQDTISEYDETVGNVDTIRFGEGIAAGDVHFARSGANLVLSIDGTSDQLTIQSWGYGDAYRIERMEFADGTIWDAAYLQAQSAGLAPVGTEGDDYLTLWSGQHSVQGLSGNDTLVGGSDGDNSLDGGEGNDTIYGGDDGNDYLVGGLGDDNLSDWGGGKALEGGDGNDYLFSASDATFMAGGKGTDFIESRSDLNVIGFNAGDGIDTVYVEGDLTLSLGGGISAENLALSIDGNKVVLQVGGSDSISLIGILAGYEGPERPQVTLQIIGTSIETYDFNAVLSQFEDAVAQGASSNDWPLGSVLEQYSFTISADQVIGGRLATQYAQEGTLTTLGSEEIHTALFQPNFGVRNVLGGGGSADILAGDSNNEFFVGRAGNDIVDTGTGIDVIAFNRGDGADIVMASTGKDNTLSLGGGIAYADLLFKKSGNDLTLVTGENEQLTFEDWYASDSNHNIAHLQVVVEDTADYDAASDNVINNRKIVKFDFEGLVARFDQALAAEPTTVANWSLSSALLDFHVNSTDSAALGGDLGYQYAVGGSLSSISLAHAQALLSSPQFGTADQDLQIPRKLQSAAM